MRRRLSIIGVLLAAVSAMITVPPARADIVNPGYTFALGPSTPSTDTGDGEPTIIRDGSDTYVVGLVSPSAPAPQEPMIFKGTSMDNLVRQPNGILDASFASPRGDRYWWNAGAWIDANGKWYVPTHVEFDFPGGGVAPMKRIGVSTSTDKGRHWHYEGDILTSDNTYDRSETHNYFDYGVGEPALLVDTAGGFFYIWYMNTFFSTTDPEEYASALRVARAPISGAMAPGTWRYFYNGAWNEPGLGGHASDLLPNASGIGVSYNTFLQKYVLTTSKLYSRNPIAATYMSTATNLTTQNWGPLHKVSDFADHYQAHTTEDGTSAGTVGQTMRWYAGGFEGGTHWQFRKITFGTGNQPSEAMAQQHYPRLSVTDANPYWDWDATPRPASFSDNFSDGTVTGWRTYNGTWSESGGVMSVTAGQGNRASIEDKWFDDFTFDADVRMAPGTGNTGVVFRGANNDYGVDNYRGYYAGFDAGQLILGRADNSSGPESWTTIETAPVNGTPNVFHHLRVVAHSGRIQVFFDNATTPAIDAADTALSFGGIGLRTFGPAASFDNVSVVRNSDLAAYNLSNNLSATQGNRNWRFQQLNGTSYVDMTWRRRTGQWVGSGAFNLVWAPSWIHPDANPSAVSWTAPKAGTVRVTGNPRKESAAGDGVDVRITKNSTQVWPASGSQHLSDTVGVTHAITVSVAAGDILHFIVDKSGTNASDATSWNPVIEYTSGAPVGQVIWLKANSNGKTVVARADEANAPLKAKSDVLGDWEKFQVIDAGSGLIALRAMSVGKYVAARSDLPATPLLGTSDTIGADAKFQWIDAGSGMINLKSNSTGRFVLARADETESPLRANSTVQGDWEKFSWGRYIS